MHVLYIPVARVGMEKGMLMTPSKSWMGIRDLRMALMRTASPLPAWINWQKSSEETKETLRIRKVYLL